jgi:KaiC/GvpD/RAD55 family RecA-like ATPase
MKTEHVPTGIPGLDELLGGGYPRGRVILITGGPGMGKTLMAMQFLIDGVERFDERGVFVSLEESKYHLFSEMQNFGWDLEKYEKKNQLAVVDASPLRQISKGGGGRRKNEEGQEGEEEEESNPIMGADEREVKIRGPEFSIQALSTVIRSYARVTRATRIVIDPITSLSFQFPDDNQRRTAIIDLLDSLMSMGTTNLVTSEMGAVVGGSPTERYIPPEEYLSHGVIVLHATYSSGKMNTLLEIEKMRETRHDRQLHPFEITEKGIVVHTERFLG